MITVYILSTPLKSRFSQDRDQLYKQDVVRLILKKYPEGPPPIRQALLVSKKALHFAKSGGAVYNDHVRAQPMARLKRLKIGKRTLVLSTR